MAEQTITAEKLCALTGLTDRRHRQLAKEGFFPPPIKSEYQLSPTIQGMFRFYRESYHATTKGLRDEKGQKLRKEIELLDMKIQEQRRELVPITEVNRVWQACATAARQTILAADIPHQTKEEICEHLRHVEIEKYIPRKTSADRSQEGAGAD